MQILEFCQRRKERGNALYAAQKFDLAVKRFDHALQVLKTYRGGQTAEQTEALNMLHITLLGNSAAALMAKEVRLLLHALLLSRRRTVARDRVARPFATGRHHLCTASRQLKYQHLCRWVAA